MKCNLLGSDKDYSHASLVEYIHTVQIILMAGIYILMSDEVMPFKQLPALNFSFQPNKPKYSSLIPLIPPTIIAWKIKIRYSKHFVALTHISIS